MGNVMRTVAAVVAMSAALAATAEAVDLRSWDQRISDPTKRFIVLGAFNSEAVLDKETQLVWARSPHPDPALTWGEAMENCHMQSLGGRSGGRLPYLHELWSLRDPSTGELPAGHPFADLQGMLGYFWSATTDYYDPSMIRVGGFGVPEASASKGDILRALCVRGHASGR
jgi:hypothetical protein